MFFIVTSPILFSCAGLETKKAKLILQEKDLVSFEIKPESVPLIFSRLESPPQLTACNKVTSGELEYLFRSLRDENPSLFARKDKSIFPTGNNLQIYNRKILNSIASSESKTPVLFFIWKEDDSLDPYTRIQRTTFYLFCEKNSMSLIFGEWKRDMVFQNQYTWSDWISASRFTYELTDKQRLFILDGFQDRVQFFAERKGNDTIVYHDWVKLYDDQVPQANQIPQGLLSSDEKKENNKSNNSLSDRLQTLEELKNKGLINDQEYQEKRKQLLDSL